MYRIGFVGAGGMARLHASSFASQPDTEIIAFMDVRREQAEAAAAPYDAAVYEDIEKMLADSPVDVLAICCPSAFHFEYLKIAVHHGLSVFLEKPIALCEEDGQEAVRISQQSDITLMVGHVVRFFSEYQGARNRIINGGLGNPVMIRTTRAGQMPRGVGDWFTRYSLSGGVIADLMIHDLDFALWCFGPARRVYAKALVTDPNATASRDHAFATVRFANNVIGHFEASWAMPQGFYTSFELSGSGGLIQYDSRKCTPYVASFREDRSSGRPGVILPQSPLHEAPYLKEIKHFMAVVRGEQELLVQPEEALDALRLAQSIWQSVRTGQPVEVAGGMES